MALLKSIAAACLLLACSGAAAGPAPYDPDRPRWATLDFSASKLLFSAAMHIEARMRPADEIAADLRPTPLGRPVAPGAEVLELTYAMNGFGRESLTTLWIDPGHGGALQREQRDGGSRPRLRIYRYTDMGAYHYTRWPNSRTEESLPPAQWTRAEEGMRAYAPEGVGKTVTEPTALLWLAAAADLSRPGDRLEAFTFSRRHVSRVTLDVTGRRVVRVDYKEETAAQTRRRQGKIEALAVRLRGSPLDPAADDEDFELLGLRGDLELLLDPQTRAPLQLRGHVRIVGEVTVRLKKLTLR